MENRLHYKIKNHASRWRVALYRKALMFFRSFAIFIAVVCGFVIGRTFKTDTVVYMDGYNRGAASLSPLIPDGFVHVDKLKPVTFTGYKPTTATDSAAVAFVKRFSSVAVDEMHKYGIPASVKLAQGGIESSWGRSKLALKNNNYFGEKCFSRTCRPGHCTNFSDDSHKDFFRKFKNAWESWRGHSLFLSKERYKKCFTFGRNYLKWCDCLKESGYATDKQYNEKLKQAIKRYGLAEFDK